ncbi:hypothetical protein E2320_016583, partial [Naja naja]
MEGVDALMGKEGMNDGNVAVQADASNEKGAAVQVDKKGKTIQFAKRAAISPVLGGQVVNSQGQQGDGIEQVTECQIEGEDDARMPGAFPSHKVVDCKAIPQNSEKELQDYDDPQFCLEVVEVPSLHSGQSRMNE